MPPTTPPTIAPVLDFLDELALAPPVGPVMIVWVTTTPLTVTTCTLVWGGVESLGRPVVGGVEEAGDEFLELVG